MWITYRHHTSGLMCIFGATVQSHQRQTLFLSTIRNHQTEGPGGPAVWSTCTSTKQYGFKYGRGPDVPTLIVTAMCFIKIRVGGKRSKNRSWVTEEWINATNAESHLFFFFWKNFSLFVVPPGPKTAKHSLGYRTTGVSPVNKFYKLHEKTPVSIRQWILCADYWPWS